MTIGSLAFIHLHLFDREWAGLGLDDDDLRMLQNVIAAAPTRPPVIAGAGGLRKIRFTEEGSGRGKSGAYRIGFAHFPEYSIVVLVTVWGKNERANLSASDRAAIAQVLKEIERLLEGRTR